MVHYSELVAAVARQARAGAVPRQAVMRALLQGIPSLLNATLGKEVPAAPSWRDAHGRFAARRQAVSNSSHNDGSDKDGSGHSARRMCGVAHAHKKATLRDTVDVLVHWPVVHQCVHEVRELGTSTTASPTGRMLSMLINGLASSHAHMPPVTCMRVCLVIEKLVPLAGQFATVDLCLLLQMYLRVPAFAARTNDSAEHSSSNAAVEVNKAGIADAEREDGDGGSGGDSSEDVQVAHQHAVNAAYWRQNDVYAVEQVLRHLISRLPRGKQPVLADDSLTAAMRTLTESGVKSYVDKTPSRYMNLRSMRVVQPWAAMTCSEFMMVMPLMATYANFCGHNHSFMYINVDTTEPRKRIADGGRDGATLGVTPDTTSTSSANVAMQATLLASKERTITPAVVADTTAVLRHFALLQHTRRIATARPLEWPEWDLIFTLMRSGVPAWAEVALHSLREASAAVSHMTWSPLSDMQPLVQRRFCSHLCTTLATSPMNDESRMQLLQDVLPIFVRVPASLAAVAAGRRHERASRWWGGGGGGGTGSGHADARTSSTGANEDVRGAEVHPAMTSIALRHVARFVTFAMTTIRERAVMRNELSDAVVWQLCHVADAFVAVLARHFDSNFDTLARATRSPRRSWQWPWWSLSDAAFAHSHLLRYRATVVLWHLHGMARQQRQDQQAPQQQQRGSSLSSSSLTRACIPHALLRRVLLEDITSVLQHATITYPVFFYSASDVMLLLQALVMPNFVWALKSSSQSYSSPRGSGNDKHRCIADALSAEEQRSIMTHLRVLLQLCKQHLPRLTMHSPLHLQLCMFTMNELTFLWRNAVLVYDNPYEPQAQTPMPRNSSALRVMQLKQMQPLCIDVLTTYIQLLSNVLLHQRYSEGSDDGADGGGRGNNSSAARAAASASLLLSYDFQLHRSIHKIVRLFVEAGVTMDTLPPTLHLSRLLQFLFDDMTAALTPPSSKGSSSSSSSGSSSGNKARSRNSGVVMRKERRHFAKLGKAGRDGEDAARAARLCTVTAYSLALYMCKLHCADEHDDTIAAMARLMRSCGTEAQLRLLDWTVREEVLPSVNATSALASAHIECSRHWRNVMQACIVTVVRLCLDRVAPRMGSSSSSGSSADNGKARSAARVGDDVLRARCAEYVWIFVTRIAFWCLREANMDVYIQAMLRFVRRYFTCPVTFNQPLLPHVVAANASVAGRTATLSLQTVQRLNELLIFARHKQKHTRMYTAGSGAMTSPSTAARCDTHNYNNNNNNDDGDDKGSTTDTKSEEQPRKQQGDGVVRNTSALSLRVFDSSLRDMPVTDAERIILQCNSSILYAAFALMQVREQLFTKRGDAHKTQVPRVVEMFNTFCSLLQRSTNVLLPYTWMSVLSVSYVLPRMLGPRGMYTETIRQQMALGTQVVVRFLHAAALAQLQQRQQQQSANNNNNNNNDAVNSSDDEDIIDMMLYEVAWFVCNDHSNIDMSNAMRQTVLQTLMGHKDAAAVASLYRSLFAITRVRLYVRMYVCNLLDYCDASISADVRCLLIQMTDRATARLPLPLLPSGDATSNDGDNSNNNSNSSNDDATTTASKSNDKDNEGNAADASTSNDSDEARNISQAYHDMRRVTRILVRWRA